ncbi:GTP cyclohydrolase II [bacterium]|jgi:3,4-dihydroxy 2-butanone 4-phosphate synthase/GTP cyclohydrolase II|nr:GTP cyclohydrolase II [bacterium]
MDTVAGNSLEDAFRQIRAGKMVVMVSDDSENGEGDLVMAAEKVTPAHVNFMVIHGRGVVSVALPEKRMRELGIPLVPSSQGDDFAEPAGALVEAREGVTTGISANDRARTIQVLASDKSGPEDLVMPGHVLPLMALSGGVMMRIGRAEGAVDLARAAGMRPVAASCAILREDGEAARMAELREFAATHDLPICFIRDLVSYRLKHEILVQRVGESPFALAGGELQAIVFRNVVDGREHLALVKGAVGNGRPALVRIHSECLTGDVFGSNRCDCGAQLAESIRRILAAEAGVIIYLHQEGRGIGLGNKIRAYALQDQGLDTVEANLELGFKEDLRDYGIGAQILRDLGVGEVRLLTNNPHKIESLQRYGVTVAREPLEVPAHRGNIEYLRTKKEKLGHLFTQLKVVT